MNVTSNAGAKIYKKNLIKMDVAPTKIMVGGLHSFIPF